MLTQSAFRAVDQLLDESPCRACGKRLNVRLSPTPDGVLIVRFACHGSYQAFTMDDELLSDVQLVDAVMRFADRAFAEEARSPDLRELIAYNRGALPEARSC